MRSSESKIVSQQKLKSLVADHKKRGHKVVFANGGFDVLHVGHVRYLEAARQHGDVLIVAVNSDVSLRTLKGPARPVLDEAARARLVAALRAVDYVVIFSEPTVGFAPRRSRQRNRLLCRYRARARHRSIPRHSNRHCRGSQKPLH